MKISASKPLKNEPIPLKAAPAYQCQIMKNNAFLPPTYFVNAIENRSCRSKSYETKNNKKLQVRLLDLELDLENLLRFDDLR